jgi:hypothetical protein
MASVPNIEAQHLRAFCSEVVTTGVPIVARCIPRFDRPSNECFSLVEEQIREKSGSMIVGWAIWERPGVFIEAEFHAVWESPEGEFIDLSPRPLLFQHVLFLPDPSRKYEGRQVDNIRKPLVRDNDVVRFLLIFEHQFKIMNNGDLAFQHGEISLPPKAAKELRTLQKEGARLERRLQRRYQSEPKLSGKRSHAASQKTPSK